MEQNEFLFDDELCMLHKTERAPEGKRNVPFALILIGVVLVVAAVRNKTTDLFGLLTNDFKGPNNYTYWMASILLIGAIGYIKPMQPLSRAFLVLVVIVLVLSHGGLFEKFNTQVFGNLSGTGTAPLGGAGSIASGNQ